MAPLGWLRCHTKRKQTSQSTPTQQKYWRAPDKTNTRQILNKVKTPTTLHLYTPEEKQPGTTKQGKNNTDGQTSIWKSTLLHFYWVYRDGKLHKNIGRKVRTSLKSSQPNPHCGDVKAKLRWMVKLSRYQTEHGARAVTVQPLRRSIQTETKSLNAVDWRHLDTQMSIPSNWTTNLT